MTMEHDNSLQRNTAPRRADSSGTSANSSKGRNRKAAPGRYLKQKPASGRRPKRRRRKLTPRFVIMLAVLLALLIGIVLILRSCNSHRDIIGRWDLDGRTVYEFRKGGKGTLVLSTSQYEFTYEIDDDVIFIDFIDQRALDARYTYEVKGEVLFVTGGPGDSRSEYVMHKID